MLTPSQQRALQTGRHLGVIANAGSGKTLVLVERYLDIVCRGAAAVDEVVAITFTEKAAGELKRRIADGITRRLLEPGADRAALERVRGQLPSAAIHTIHGFCSRLLREFPVEGGVDASFTVIEPIDRETLLQESFAEVYRAILREDAHPDLRPPLLELACTIGKKSLLQILESMAARHETMIRLTGPDGVYSRDDDQIPRWWREQLAEHLRRAMDDPSVIGPLRAVITAATGKSAADMLMELRRVESAGNLDDRSAALATILENVFTAGGAVSKRFMGKGTALPDNPHLATIAGRLHPLLFAVRETDSDIAHAELLRATRTLLAVYRLAVERYRDKKNAAGQLDFDDLQLLARDLLNRELVRTRLAARYRFIMVDEYQDTNRLQYEILLPLISQYNTGNLFIVGDPKQSIYGFRNADVAVFSRTCEDIRARGGEDSLIVLGESFRLLPDLAAFTNSVFRAVMGTGGPGTDVAYDELIAARPGNTGGRVETLLLPADGTMPEAEAVARRVRQLFGGGFTVYDRNEHPRPVRLSDIAVLLRSRKSLGDFEKAFVRHGVPYVVTGGTGYFQTQTIFDFTNIFRFIVNRHDDVALAGILRSPLYSVSDAELFAVAGLPRSGSLWDFLRNFPALAGIPPLERAVRMLAEDLEAGPRMTVPEFLDRLVERSGIEAVSGAVPRGDQGLANLRKLSEIARAFEGRGFTTLYDFTARLQRLVEEEEKEGQAVIDVQRDAVRIMTVHAAKGLEFPVVIVPTLERTFLSDRQPFIDETLGIGFSHVAAGNTAGPAPLVEFLRQEARHRAVAEEKRIFYVACTRARDCLILSARETSSSAPSWLLWLKQAIRGIGSENAAVEVVSVLRRAATAGGKAEPEMPPHTLRIHIVREQDLAELPPISIPRPETAEPARIAIGPVQQRARGEVFTASSIRTYLECPAKYYLQYVLGLPSEEQGGREAGPDEDRETATDPGVKGTITHRALQYADGVPHDHVHALVRRSAAQEGVRDDAVIDELTTAVQDVLRSPFWRGMQSGKESRTEVALTGTLGEVFVTGTIDRLFRDADGCWHVVDYKTDRIGTESLADRTHRYLPQLKMYAYLVSRLHPGSSVRCTLLFTARVDKPQTVLLGPAEISAFEEELRQAVHRINSLDFKPIGSPCPVCPLTPEVCSRLTIPSSGQFPKG